MQLLDVISKIAQIIIAFTAVWASFRLLDWCRRPKLRILFDQHNGSDVQRSEIQLPDKGGMKSGLGICIRGRIYNDGKSSATNVEVTLIDLLEKRGQDFARVAGFLPINLPWSHTQNIEVKGMEDSINPVYLSYLSPHCEKPFKIASMTGLENEVFRFGIITRPLSGFWSFPSIGEFRFKIAASAPNVKNSKTETFYLSIIKRYSEFDVFEKVIDPKRYLDVQILKS